MNLTAPYFPVPSRVTLASAPAPADLKSLRLAGAAVTTGLVVIVIECEGGHVTVPSYTAATAYDKSGAVIKSWKGSDDHFANFIKAVRSRKYSDLNADIHEGHLSSALCHTGNISYQLGMQQPPGKIREEIRGDKRMVECFERMAEHLAANGVDMAKERLTLGVVLKMDPRTERFIGNDKANQMLTRPYRPGFVVPDKA